MIKIEAVTRADGISAITLTSNDPKKDQEQLDLIGNLILSRDDKRGRFLLNGSVEILVNPKTKV